MLQRIAAKSMRGEACEDVAVPGPGAFDPAKYVELIVFVRDAESRLELDVWAEFPEQRSAKRVERAARDAFRGWAELRGKAVGDLTGGFVREGEGTDPCRIEIVAFDQEANAFRETKGFPRPRPCEDKQWPRLGLDGVSL